MFRLRLIFISVIFAAFTCACEEIAHRFPELAELPARRAGGNLSVDELLAKGRAAFKRGNFGEADGNFALAVEAAKSPGVSKKSLAEATAWLGESRLKLARYADAESRYIEAVALWTAETGARSLETLRARHGLADVYRNGGYFDDSEQIYKQILEELEWPKKENLDIAATLNDLGDTYRCMARHEESEKYIRKALDLRTRLAGPRDAATAQSMVDLAKLYWQSKQYQAASDYFEKGFLLQEAALGAEHPDLTETLDYWGDLYSHLGDYTKAEAMLERGRALCEKTLGKDHARYSDLLNDLGLIYKYTERYDKAERYFKESLHICETVLGKHHCYYAIGLNNLGHYFLARGKLKEAEDNLKLAVEAFRNAFGENNPRQTDPLGALADIYETTERIEEAEGTFKRIYALREKHLEQNDTGLAKSLLKWAEFNARHQRARDAQLHSGQALELLRNGAQGDKHARAELLMQFTKFEMSQDRFQESEKFALEALKLKQEAGEKGQMLEVAYGMLFAIYINLERMDDAAGAFESMCKANPLSTLVATAALPLAQKAIEEKNWKRAEAIINAAMPALKKAEDSSKLGTGLILLGISRLWLKQFKEAEEPLKELASDFKKYKIEDKEWQVTALRGLQDALAGQRKIDEAKAVEKRIKELGPVGEPKLDF